MKNIFRIGMIILLLVIAFISFRRDDMTFVIISIILAILFIYNIIRDNKKSENQ